MPGLIDSSEGLSFGDTLQFQREIGSAGLIIVSDDFVAAGSMITEASVLMVDESSVQMVTQTT